MRSLIRRVRFARDARRCLSLLAPMTLGLACIVAVVFHQDALAQMEKKIPFAELKNRVVAALQSPFALLDERSPGGRGSGPQRLTKTTGGPHERVLAETRTHEPAADVPPDVDGSKTSSGSGPAAITGPNGLPAMSFASGEAPNAFSPFDGAFGLPNAFLPFAGGATPPSSGADNPVTLPITGVSDPGSLPPTGTGNAEFPAPPTVTDVPPQISDVPPGAPPTTGSGTPTIPVPEPASWGLMLLGFVAVAALRHSKKRRLAA